MTEKQVEDFIADLYDLQRQFVAFGVKWKPFQNPPDLTDDQMARISAAEAAFGAALDSVFD